MSRPGTATTIGGAPPLLEVRGLGMRFGGLAAVEGLDLALGADEIFAIIGPNGAGKTTLFNCIGGFYRPSAGAVRLGGRPITGLPTHVIARHGLVRTFQNVRLFRSMTAVENLLVAQHHRLRTGLLAGLLATPAYRRAEHEAIDRAAYWLDLVGLREYANREAGKLAYGHQRRLEIARCMIAGPRVLMLDEPAAGLNPQEKIELSGLIRELQGAHGVAVLLIEHDMSLVMGVSERILVMDQGRAIMTGTPAAVQRDERVIRAYLGEA